MWDFQKESLDLGEIEEKGPKNHKNIMKMLCIWSFCIRKDRKALFHSSSSLCVKLRVG